VTAVSTPPKLLMAKEVAVLLGVHHRTVLELVREGHLRSIRFGSEGWHRFDPREVERFIQSFNREEGENDP
jgi:excisionase family DNA binding protein